MMIVDVTKNIEFIKSFNMKQGDVVKYFDSFAMIIDVQESLFWKTYSIIILSSGVFADKGELLSVLEMEIK